MDLSFGRFERERQVAVMPADLAVLMVGVAARQAASPTALTVALADILPSGRFAPPTGAFHAGVAAWLADRRNLNAAFTEPLQRTLSRTGLDGPGVERGPPAPIEVAE